MTIELLLGDCRDKLPELQENSIDVIVTDPPYMISFMGKKWDSTESIEGFFIPIWNECLRVLKSGSFAFVMSSPRADVLSKQIICLEKAGFNVSFSPIYWAFASGFPKAMNLSKVADKRGGNYLGDFGRIIKNRREELGLSRKELAKHFLSKTGGLTGCVWNWENGQGTPTLEQYNKLIDVLDLNKKNSKYKKLTKHDYKKLTEYEREVIGIRMNGSAGGSIVTDTGEYIKTLEREIPITKPASYQAKKLDGSYAGFQPKPAVEVIIVAMKPLSEKTYIDQALKSFEDESRGLGGSWLGECLIPFKDTNDKWNEVNSKKFGDEFFVNEKQRRKIKDSPNNNGRFPANLLVSDDILSDDIIHKSGSLKLDYNLSAEKTNNIYGFMPRIDKEHIGDSGSFSRYFDLDLWFKEKTKNLPRKQQKVFPFAIIPKPSKTEKNKGVTQSEKTIGHNRFDKCGNCDGYLLQNRDRPSACSCDNPIRQDNVVKGNFHPTVKPIKLMSYLITLALGKSKLKDKRVVLDCFAGSGTTAIASRLLGFNAIVIEKNPEYFELMKSRIDYYLEQKKLFDFTDEGVEGET